MEAQAQGRCGVIPAQTLDEGVAARLRAALSRYSRKDIATRYLTRSMSGTEVRARFCVMPALVTGGLGWQWGWRVSGRSGVSRAGSPGYPLSGRAVVLSGSCSPNDESAGDASIDNMLTRDVDVARCLSSETRGPTLARWRGGCSVRTANWRQ